MSELVVEPEPAAALDRLPLTSLDLLPLASLALAAGGSVIAANQAWASLSGMTRDESRGDGWLGALEPLDRDGLSTRLRDAAQAATGGTADWRLAGPRGRRWSRWWWAPDGAGGLVICVADIDDDTSRAAPSLSAPGPYPVPRPAPNRDHEAAARPADGLTVRDADAVTELAALAVQRISGVAMTLASALSLSGGRAGARVERAADQLDDLIREIRLTAFQRRPSPASPVAPRCAR